MSNHIPAAVDYDFFNGCIPCDSSCCFHYAKPIIERAKLLEAEVQKLRIMLTESKSLSKLGEDSQAAWEHGDWTGVREADSEIRRIHDEIDAALQLKAKEH